MRNALLAVLLAAPAHAAPADASAQEWLTARVPSWELRKGESEKDLGARIAAEAAAAAKDGVDVLVLPEGFAGARCPDFALDAVKAAAGPDMLVALGTSACKDKGAPVARSFVLSNGVWQSLDRVDPTPAERAAKPPVKPGQRLILFKFRGALAAALPAWSAQKPDLSAALKKRGVSLLLVTAPAGDDDDWRRTTRTASARAVELGAAVVIAAPGGPTWYLPAQKGFEPALVGGRDARLPWKRLLALREPGSSEPRPFLDPATYLQVEY